MSKKGFLASLIIAIVATLSLSIYTIVSVCIPAKNNNNGDKAISLAFRNGEVVEQLNGYKENENLTFEVSEGEENPLEYNAETNQYVTKDVNASVVAVISKKGGEIKYNINVYHHNELGLSADEPYIVASKAHLVELKAKLEVPVESGEKSEPSYISLVSDIDLAGENWSPIGNVSLPAVGITFEGNNHSIKNMTISVDSENYTNYVTVRVADVSGSTKKVAYMHLGLFGRTTVSSQIKNIKMENANISVTSEVYDIISAVQPEGSAFNEFRQIGIGALVGSALETKIDNVSVDSNVSAFSYTSNGFPNGVGGIVGVMNNAQVVNSKANLTFAESKIHSVSDIPTISSSFVGGVAGFATTFEYRDDIAERILTNKNTIDNCETTVNATVYYQNHTYLAGLVGYAENSSIKNSVVKSFKAVDSTPSASIQTAIEKSTNVAGAVGRIYTRYLAGCPDANMQAYASEIINVRVESIDVTLVGGQAYGLVAVSGTDIDANRYEKTTIYIKDCSVAGSISARVSAGFGGYIRKETEVVYSDEFNGNAVEGTISGHSCAAFAYTLEGNVSGNAGKTVNINVTLKGKGANVKSDTNTHIVYNQTFTAGFGYVGKRGSELTPKIENLVFEVNAINELSFAGVVFNSYGAQIKNCKVVANVVSYNNAPANRSKTYMVAGVVGNAYENTLVDAVEVSINLNQGVDKNVKYGANYFGGAVARIHSDKITVSNNTITANAYVNDAYQEVVFYPDASASSVEYGKVFLAGGVVGSIQKYGEGTSDQFAEVSTNNVKIENNTVSFNIEVDFIDNSFADGNKTQAFRVRAVGAIIGNLNSTVEGGTEFDLSTNTVSAYNLKANKATFTYSYTVSGIGTISRNSFGFDGDVIKYACGVCLNYQQTAMVIDPDMTNATFEAIA